MWGVALAAFGGGAAFANGDGELCFDKATLTYVDCPTPVAPALWDGPYLGLHGGYASADFGGVFNGDGVTAPVFDLSDLDVQGGVVGGQLGYLHTLQRNGLVLGAEVDFSLAFADDELSFFDPAAVVVSDTDFDLSVQLRGELNWLASARLRAGLDMDELMPFVTGGVAMASWGFEASTTLGPVTEAGSADETTFGGVVGGGIEWMIDEDISVRAEGLYYLFDDSIDASTINGLADAGDHVDFGNVLVVRAAVNLFF